MTDLELLDFFDEFSQEILSNVHASPEEVFAGIPARWKSDNLIETMRHMPDNIFEHKLEANRNVSLTRIVLKYWCNHPELSAIVEYALDRYEHKTLGFPPLIETGIFLSLVLLAASSIEVQWKNTVIKKKGLREMLLGETISSAERELKQAFPSETEEANNRIVFMASSPVDMARLRIDKELSEIKSLLNNNPAFTVRYVPAVKIEDLQHGLQTESPHIVHFSGHGSTEGIIVEDADGIAFPVNSSALSELFGLLKRNIKCVFLNACYSKTQAATISRHIPFVIGMSGKVNDAASLEFSKAFYRSLSNSSNLQDHNIIEAFNIGKNSIKMHQLSSDIEPVIYQ